MHSPHMHCVPKWFDMDATKAVSRTAGHSSLLRLLAVQIALLTQCEHVIQSVHQTDPDELADGSVRR